MTNEANKRKIQTMKVPEYDVRGIIIDATFQYDHETRAFLTECSMDELQQLCAHLLKGLDCAHKKIFSSLNCLDSTLGKDDDF